MQSYKDLNKIYMDGNIRIDGCKLESLEGCPQHITGGFWCDINKITSLVGGPQIVDSNYDCRGNQLSSLIGCASHIGGTLFTSGNSLTTLVGIHKIIKSCNVFYFDAYKITEGGIGLLLIDDLIHISNDEIPFKIILKYLGAGTKGMMACRAELIETGYENYAKL